MRSDAGARRAPDMPLPEGVGERYIAQPESDEITRFCWAPDGSCLACPTASGDLVLCAEKGTTVLELPDSEKEVQPSEGPRYRVPRPALAASWSADSRNLLSCTLSGNLFRWDATKGALAGQIPVHSDWIASVAWNSHDGRVATGSRDHTVRIWSDDDRGVQQATVHDSGVSCVSWSPTGATLASSSMDGTVILWEPHTGDPVSRIYTQSRYVLCVCWNNSAETLATGSADATVRIWDPERGTQLQVLQGHTAPVASLSFSCDGRLLASASLDSTVRIWRCDTWEEVAVLRHGSDSKMFLNVAFHPFEPVLAIPGDSRSTVRVLEYDFALLARKAKSLHGVRYRNAKVVLVGDTGAGKSALGLVLAGHAFRPTESTAGRRVWALDHADDAEELRETFLWDLPGQSGHRLVNQLHLQDVAVAVVVFDGHSEKDAFGGVKHWIRALRQARLRQPGWDHPLRPILVAGRCDASGPPASRSEVAKLQQELGNCPYFQTSAREGWEVAELREAIRKSIDWERLPTTSSSHRLHSVRRFLTTVRSESRLLIGMHELYDRYARTAPFPNADKASREEFAAVVRLLGTRGVVYNFGFSDLVLLAPEYLDYYASAVVHAARDEPLGMGSVLERDVTEARLRLASANRYPHPDGEKLLLIATVETLLQNEVALRESTEDGDVIVFPAQFRHDRSDGLPPEQRVAKVRFEGPVQNIYASLVVRLTHSRFYRKRELWRNGALFDAETGGTCGLILIEDERGSAELQLFFGAETSGDMRNAFESYVIKHLTRSAIANSVTRTQVHRCPQCFMELAEFQVDMLLKRGLHSAACVQCRATISLTEDRATDAEAARFIPEIDLAANQARKYAMRVSQVRGRKALNQYDVFLSYNRKDAKDVQRVARFLQKRGIATWLDLEDMPAGVSWQQALEKTIGTLNTALIFCGRNGLGPRQSLEIDALVDRYAGTDLRLIPVILPAAEQVEFPLFVRNRNWIDLREPGQFRRLVSEVRAAVREKAET